MREATAHLDMIIALGLPVRAAGKLYNCAAVLHRGQVLGFVPKTRVPNYSEFYERRWFSGADALFSATVKVPGQEAPVLVAQQLFACPDVPNLTIGVEICEDLWASDPPSNALARAGATLICNLSASDELVGKADYRRQLVSGQSARLLCAYIYADAGEGESSTDLVFAGHNLIAENGAILAETRFTCGLIVTEVDVDRLMSERRKNTTFQSIYEEDLGEWGIARVTEADLKPADTVLTRFIAPNPFVRTTGTGRPAARRF